MSFRRDLHDRARGRLAAGLALLLAALGGGACGHKENPKPPPRMIPATTYGLKVHQRGTEAVLRFPFPTTTLRGAALSGLAKVDIYQYTTELPEEALELQRQEIRDYRQRLKEYEEALAERQAAAGAAGEEDDGEAVEEGEEAEQAGGDEVEEGETEGAEGTGEAEGDETEEEGEEEEEEELRHPGVAPTLGDIVLVDARSFRDEAALVRSLKGAELEAAILGSEILVRLPLAELPAAGATGYAFAVETTSLEGLPSALSSFAKLVAQEPPPAPTDLTIEPEARGIELEWAAAEDPEESFKVYRREAQTRAYADAIASPAGTLRTHTDYSAVMEARYIYAVTAVAQDTPLLESALSTELEVYYQDRFPPGAPAGVAAFPEAGAVRVLWEPPADEDVAGYIVTRRPEEGEARTLMEEPLDDLEYVDREAPAASIQYYAVVAVDGHGNRSEASDEVRVRVP